MPSILHGALMDVSFLRSNLPTLKVGTDTSWMHLKVIQENSVMGWPNDFQSFNLDLPKSIYLWPNGKEMNEEKKGSS
jgi:hypothetical protein